MAECMLIVRFWVDPAGKDALMGWLDGSHMADVVSQPGFRSVRRIKLDGAAEDGWLAYMMVYEIESRAALEAYSKSPLQARFAEERKPFERYLRIERAWGEVERSLGS